MRPPVAGLIALGAATALFATSCRGRQPTPAPGVASADPPRPATPPATAMAPTASAKPATGTAAQPAARIRHVIIISEDGLRPDALMDVQPPVHVAVMGKGAYSMRARTIRHASTLPAHAAMLSGFDVDAHGLDWNAWKPERGNILVPTVFDAATRAGMGAAAFVGKRKLEHIAHPGSVDLFSRPGIFCKTVVAVAARYFVEKRPQIEFVHFSDPDERGHADGWMSDTQFSAIRHSDQCLGTLIDAVTAAGLDGETLFLLSADHGGHGHNHSGSSQEDRLIPWVAWGPGVRAHHRIQAPISTVDTAATVLWVLGYPAPPGMLGRPVREAFEEADAKELDRIFEQRAQTARDK